MFSASRVGVVTGGHEELLIGKHADLFEKQCCAKNVTREGVVQSEIVWHVYVTGAQF